MSQEQSFFGTKRLVVIGVVIAIAAMGLAVASKLVRGNSAPVTPATTAVAPAVTPAPATAVATATATPATPGNTTDATAATAAFSGTSWKLDDISASLEPGGLLKARSPKVPFPLEGTWVIKDNVMTLSAVGKTFTLQIDGDKLIKDGKILERIPK